MLLRLMMAVCIWMMAVMPCAWAEEADTSSEQALSALTLAVDTYQKKDTYYIRCTFTNPTDEPINKQIDHLDIEYAPHYADRAVYEERPARHLNTIHQYNDTVTELSVPPRGTFSFSIPINLPQPTNAPIFFVFSQVYLQFTDDTSLLCLRKSIDPIAYAYPVTLYSGKPYLYVNNLSSQTKITEIKDIAIYTHCTSPFPPCSLVYHYYNTEPITLDIAPNKHTFVPLPNTIKSCSSHEHYSVLYIKINGARYGFTHIVDESLYSGYLDSWTCYPSSYGYEPGIYPIQLTASYEIDGSVLHAYCRIKNLQDKPVRFDSHDIPFDFTFTYYNQNNLEFSMDTIFLQRHATTQSSYSTTLSPNEEEFFTFSFTLPSDFKKLKKCHIYYEEIDRYKIHSHTIPIEKKLSPLQKVLYIDLGKAILADPNTFYHANMGW